MTAQTEISNKKIRGKPRIYKERMQIYAVTLDERTIQKALEIGDGNLSKGIRLMFELAYPRKEG